MLQLTSKTGKHIDKLVQQRALHWINIENSSALSPGRKSRFLLPPLLAAAAVVNSISNDAGKFICPPPPPPAVKVVGWCQHTHRVWPFRTHFGMNKWTETIRGAVCPFVCGLRHNESSSITRSYACLIFPTNAFPRSSVVGLCQLRVLASGFAGRVWRPDIIELFCSAGRKNLLMCRLKHRTTVFLCGIWNIELYVRCRCVGMFSSHLKFNPFF